jgi:hypothetical protein
MAQAKRKERTEELTVDGATANGDASEGGEQAGAWQKPNGLTPRGWAIIAGLAVVLNAPLIHFYLLRSAPEATVTLPFQDDFENPGTVEKNYFSTGGFYRTVNGELLSPGVKNNPLWVKAKLPQNVAVEFDVKSMSPEGDVKVEIFGDGSDHASGYVLIHGGWNNSMSVIARLDEHGVPLGQLLNEANGQDLVKSGVFKKDTRMRVEGVHRRVEIAKSTHWRIERRGAVITWFLDGQKYMEFNDPIPLVGEGHNRFAFSSWEAQLYFDNLSITAL